MINNKYLPEGILIKSEVNNEYLSSLTMLEKAMSDGIILEGVASRCDNDYKLSVNLGNYVGYMDREEVMMTSIGESVKDIAIITRVGKPICFKIYGIDKGLNGEPIIKLSRRMAQLECMENKLSKLNAGDIIPACVTHLEQFGAFVDIGCGIISLLSIDSISVSRISHPKDRLFVGNKIYCIIKSIDSEANRIYVSHKELLGTWEENVRDFEVGQTVTGIVRSIEDYGIFVELTPNLAGLAEYKEGIEVGQKAAVYIKNIIPERMKIKLVIIDACKNDSTRNSGKFKYYYQNEHIDSWKYSPESSLKTIETIF